MKSKKHKRVSKFYGNFDLNIKVELKSISLDAAPDGTCMLGLLIKSKEIVSRFALVSCSTREQAEKLRTYLMDTVGSVYKTGRRKKFTCSEIFGSFGRQIKKVADDNVHLGTNILRALGELDTVGGKDKSKLAPIRNLNYNVKIQPKSHDISANEKCLAAIESVRKLLNKREALIAEVAQIDEELQQKLIIN